MLWELEGGAWEPEVGRGWVELQGARVESGQEGVELRPWARCDAEREGLKG